MTQKERNVQVKAWLWQYRNAKKEWQRKDEEVAELIQTQEAAKAIEYSDMPHGSMSEKDLSDLMVVRDAYITKAIKAREAMTQAFKTVSSAIDRLDRLEHREVLTLRYLRLDGLRKLSWEEIAEKVGYSVDYALEMHGKALSEISQLIPENPSF